jgi:hypothetical protein
MIAAYDAQYANKAVGEGGTPVAVQAATAAPGAAPAAAAQAPAVDPNAPVPKLSDEPKVAEEPKAPEVPALQAKFNDVLAGIGAESVPEDVAKVLTDAGFAPEQVKALNDRMKGLLALEAQVQTERLQAAVGGKEQFNALIAWGQKNLTPEQRTFYDQQLNGPNAAEHLAVLQQKMGASRDPSLTLVNSRAAPAAIGFADKAEMQVAMSDPRYQTSEAFRAEVAQKLRVSRF